MTHFRARCSFVPLFARGEWQAVGRRQVTARGAIDTSNRPAVWHAAQTKRKGSILRTLAPVNGLRLRLAGGRMAVSKPPEVGRSRCDERRFEHDPRSWTPAGP